MIPYYEKSCCETPITKAKAKLLSQALALLNKKYDAMLHSALGRLPMGTKVLAEHSAKELSTWFASKEPQSEVVLGLFGSRRTGDIIFAITLKPMDKLQTSFGKRCHHKGFGYLSTLAFSSRTNTVSEVKAFHADLARALQSTFRLKKPPAVAPISVVNDTFERLQASKHSTNPIPSTLIPALELLKDTGFRNVVSRAKQAKDPTLANIVTSTGLTAEAVRPLLSAGLRARILVRHYNVICQSCKTVLTRVPTKAAVAQMAENKAACPKCKACVTPTSSDDCYMVADHISAILDRSKWLDLFVRNRLKPYCQPSRILTEVIDGPNELDLVANLDGKLLLAELKDSRFSIGHAYSFVGKCSQYKPHIALIIATEGVDPDVKEYIQNTEIHTDYIESLDKLDSTFEALFAQLNAQTMASLISEVPWTSLATQALLARLGVSIPALDEPIPSVFRRRILFPRRPA